VKALILIIVGTALVNNVVLSQFLGICSFLGVSKQMKASASLGGAVVFVITIASAVAWLLYHYILEPLHLDFMKTIVFILVIAALVQIVEMFLKKKSPAVYKALGIFLPLITTNCAVLGVAINVVTKEFAFVPGGVLNLGQALVYAFATSLGYGLAMVIFAGIREHLALNNVPKAFKGVPIAIISVGILALAFMGFSGMVK
jgi:electron transport complex protein RnfA